MVLVEQADRWIVKTADECGVVTEDFSSAAELAARVLLVASQVDAIAVHYANGLVERFSVDDAFEER